MIWNVGDDLWRGCLLCDNLSRMAVYRCSRLEKLARALIRNELGQRHVDRVDEFISVEWLGQIIGCAQVKGGHEVIVVVLPDIKMQGTAANFFSFRIWRSRS